LLPYHTLFDNPSSVFTITLMERQIILDVWAIKEIQYIDRPVLFSVLEVYILHTIDRIIVMWIH